MKEYKVLAINPGSTSTKIALSKGFDLIYNENITHNSNELAKFDDIIDQFEYRKNAILNALKKAGYQKEDLNDIDAFSARSGGFQGMDGGIYEIDDLVIATSGKNGVKHPSVLGVPIANSFREEYGGRAFILNTPDTDEYDLISRITGLKNIYRSSAIHALNQKEIGIRYSNKQSKNYKDMNLIICHIGGGISITAHKAGRMIDSNDIARGEGPMAPTRCGSLPVSEVIKLCFSGEFTEDEMKSKVTKTGGFVDHLSTSDAREVSKMIEEGDEYAKLIYDAMIYQIAKEIGAMAVALSGKVDCIILTGGISNDKYVVDELFKRVSFIAPIEVMAGEFEMEALVAGAVRALDGSEELKIFTDKPVFTGLNNTEIKKQVN